MGLPRGWAVTPAGPCQQLGPAGGRSPDGSDTAKVVPRYNGLNGNPHRLTALPPRRPLIERAEVQPEKYLVTTINAQEFDLSWRRWVKPLRECQTCRKIKASTSHPATPERPRAGLLLPSRPLFPLQRKKKRGEHGADPSREPPRPALPVLAPQGRGLLVAALQPLGELQQHKGSGVTKTENLTLYSADGRSPHPRISLAPHPAGASRPAALGAVPPALPGHRGGWRPFLTSSDLCSPEEGGEGDEHGHRRVPGPPFRFPSRGPSLHLHAGRPQAWVKPGRLRLAAAPCYPSIPGEDVSYGAMRDAPPGIPSLSLCLSLPLSLCLAGRSAPSSPTALPSDRREARGFNQNAESAASP